MNRLFERPALIVIALVALAAIAAAAIWYWRGDGNDTAGSAAQQARAAGFDAREQAAIAALVRDYILEHPEILPEAVERLRQREAGEQVAAIRDELVTPFPGAVMGNPNGSRTLVMFTDYACGFCRQSVPDVHKLIAEDADLRVVVRELPILSDASADAARVALAAAGQGKYAAFHDAMYETGNPTPGNIEKAARAAGIDLSKAPDKESASAIEAEIEANRRRAMTLQLQGTPAWVVGDKVLQGMVGFGALRHALYGE